MTLLEIFEKVYRRFGLELDASVPMKVDEYELRASLTIPDSGIFGAIALNAEMVSRYGAFVESLVMREVLGLYEEMLRGWHYEKLRAREPELPWIHRGRRCPIHRGNAVTSIHFTKRTYGCDGMDDHHDHEMPKRCVVSHGPGIEVLGAP